MSEIDRKIYRNIEVFVMATMSSGKSTLINALLSKKLLPSSNEACTATITKVMNTNQENYSAKAYSEKRELLYKEYRKNPKQNANGISTTFLYPLDVSNVKKLPTFFIISLSF